MTVKTYRDSILTVKRKGSLAAAGPTQYNRLLVLTRKGTFPDDRWLMYAQELAVLVSTPGGALWRTGNPHFADLRNAVDRVDADSGMDMKLRRDDRLGSTSSSTAST